MPPFENRTADAEAGALVAAALREELSRRGAAGGEGVLGPHRGGGDPRLVGAGDDAGRDLAPRLRGAGAGSSSTARRLPRRASGARWTTWAKSMPSPPRVGGGWPFARRRRRPPATSSSGFEAPWSYFAGAAFATALARREIFREAVLRWTTPFDEAWSITRAAVVEGRLCRRQLPLLERLADLLHRALHAGAHTLVAGAALLGTGDCASGRNGYWPSVLLPWGSRRSRFLPPGPRDVKRFAEPPRRSTR